MIVPNCEAVGIPRRTASHSGVPCGMEWISSIGLPRLEHQAVLGELEVLRREVFDGLVIPEPLRADQIFNKPAFIALRRDDQALQFILLLHADRVFIPTLAPVIILSSGRDVEQRECRVPLAVTGR